MRRIVLVSIVVLSWCSMVAPLTYAQSEDRRLPESETQTPGAADSDTYVIGPEDVLFISVWKEEALSKRVIVRMDGRISLPLIDEIQASGQTPLGLKEILTKRFSEFVHSPNVSVIVMEANSQKVFISGQVRTPGIIHLRSETSLAQVILMAGGYANPAGQKKIMVVRKEDGQQKVMTVSYKPERPGADSQLEQLKKLLSLLETSYTQKHPDVIATKKKIANLEQRSKLASEEEKSDPQDFGTNLILKAGDTIIVLDVVPQADDRSETVQDQEKPK